MSTFHHITVLRNEVAELLTPSQGKRILDGTLGGGGHSEALLERDATVIGLDKDADALEAAKLRLERFGDRFSAVQGDFRDSRKHLDDQGVAEVDGVVVDLGVSSVQFDRPERGFSFGKPGPLDMRMDPSRGEPLSAWLARSDEGEIEHVLRSYGEEPAARRVARAITLAVAEGRLIDTAALAKVVAEAIPRATWPKAIHPATRTFQALRIAINDELGALNAWLEALPTFVAIGGRACAISFHSLEDRPVKQRFVELSKGCICPPDLPICGCGRKASWRLVTRKAVTASEDEMKLNPRARSAHLRCIERIAA